MDKAEYKIKLNEINTLAETGKFQEAAKIADEIDWRHVKSVRTLSMIGEIYEANRDYDESLRILKYAYRRSSSSKTVLYRIAELEIRTGNYDEAKRFINEFEQNSPNDTSRYILRYKLLRATKAPLDDQIAVLKEYRDTEYTERWAYELAKLYKKNGQNEKCIEECDDMILWFSEGRYVQKALELKMSLTELTPTQKTLYETNEKKIAEEETKRAEEAAKAAEKAAAAAERAEDTKDPDEVRDLNGLETVEKAVLELDNEDEESKPKVSAGEAIMRMETAAGFTVGDKGSKEKKAAEEKEEAVETPGAAVPEAVDLGEEPDQDFTEAVKPEDLQEEQETAEETPDADEDSGEEETAEAAVKEETKKERESAAGYRKRLMSGLKAVFAGIRRGTEETEEDEDEDAPVRETFTFEEPEEEKKEETPAAISEAVTGNEQKTESVESPENGAQTQETEGPKEQEASGGKPKSDTIDLAALFAETGNALASEVASGNYKFADALKDDAAPEEEAAETANAVAAEAEASETVSGEAEKAAEAAETAVMGDDTFPDEVPEEIAIPGADEIRNVTAKAAGEDTPAVKAAEEAAGTPEAGETDGNADEDRSNLYARETDESLGLTREFHIQDELDRVLAERAAKAEGAEEKLPDVTPEQAAKRTAIEANGGVYEPETDARETGEEADAFYAAEAEESGVPEEEIPEIPEEVPAEAIMNLQEPEKHEVPDTREIIDGIIEVPEYFTPIPVEGRQFTEQEKKALAYFAEIPGIDYQITSAIADIHNNCGDRTSRSGNILVMGRMGSGKTSLAEGLVRAASLHLGLKAVRQAKIVAQEFNKRDPAAVVKKMAGGFLIIEAAGALSDDSVSRLNQAMEFRTDDLIVILEDEKSDLMKMLNRHPGFASKFTSTITVPVFTNDELVSFGKICADDEGYKLDEMATLALYTMIGENQKDAEPVTIGMVKEMVDRAIDRSSRKFRFGKADREDGKILLHEKDFSF